jgi:hypothetical protein
LRWRDDEPHGSRVRYEVSVILRVDDSPSATSLVQGEVESRYGRQSFSGWLELLSHLEALVDRARTDPARATTRRRER